MNRLIASSAITLIVICGILVSAAADAKDKTERYEVTITNITRGQIISPPIVISHNEDFQLFSLASPASAELAMLAEDGLTDPLSAYLDTLDSVFQYSTAGGGIPPGESVTVVIETKKGYDLLSAAGMLVTTNDAFFAVRGVKARSKGDEAFDAEAYDSGTEGNSEDCAFIPGPPCGSPEQRDTAGAEGYVFIHAGMHGVGDLDPAQFDWRNPVATIRVQKVR
jgi:hypothetical protein